MSATVLKPTPEILRALRLIDDAIPSALRARGRSHRSGEWEAEVEANLLLNLVIRHVEGVVVLGRRDLVLLPSAWVLARSAFETSVRLLWLMDPNDPYEREARWLAHLRTDEDFYARLLGDNSSSGGIDPSELERRRDGARNFRLAVTDKLQPQYRATAESKVPPLPEVLAALGKKSRYGMYRFACQFAHSTHHATWLYRTGGLGTFKEIGEFVRSNDWGPVARVAWVALVEGATAAIGAPDPAHVFTSSTIGMVEAALDAVTNADGGAAGP